MAAGSICHVSQLGELGAVLQDVPSPWNVCVHVQCHHKNVFPRPASVHPLHSGIWFDLLCSTTESGLCLLGHVNPSRAWFYLRNDKLIMVQKLNKSLRQ